MPKYKIGKTIFNIPNEKVDAFLKQYPNATSVGDDAGVVDPYHLGTKKKDLIDRLTPEQAEVVRTDDVRRLQHQAGQSGIYGEKVTVEEFAKRNPEWTKQFEAEYGKFDPKKHTGIFQKEYNDHVKTLAKKRALEAGYPDSEAEKMANDWVEVMGFQAGYTKGDPRGQDKKFGEFTSSRLEPQWKPYSETPPIEKEPPSDQTIIEDKEKPKEEKPKEEFKRFPPAQQPGTPYHPWWLQDIVKIAGAAGDLARVKRYQPWQATPQVYLPEVTFYDPTRELGANAEQANIQTQGMAAFTGPQALSARSSSIQGQALKNAADIMARYNNLNVGLANQFNKERTDILNAAAQNKANLDTQLYDKYTVINQKFDNSENLARQNVRQSYIDAITNRAKAQALNTLYDNYYTDPSTGGMIGFNPYFVPTPNQPSKTMGDELKSLMDQGFTRDEAIKILTGRGSSSKNEADNRGDYLSQQAYT